MAFSVNESSLRDRLVKKRVHNNYFGVERVKLLELSKDPTYFVEVYVVIKRNDGVYRTVLANPRDCITANRKENQSHVELQGFCSTFSSG